MMLKNTALSLLLLFLLSHSTIAQKNTLSFLNNRFFCTFPDSAKNVARGADIMSADPNMNIETRIIYDMGDKRIVFFAQELNMSGVVDLEKKLQTENTKEHPLTVKMIFNKDSVQCFTLTPANFNDKSEAILVNSLLVKNADNILSTLNVYLNPKAFIDKKTFDKIIEDVFASFKKGTRRLNLNAHTESFAVLDTKTMMQLKLPDNYIVTVDKKYDFEVYKVKKVKPYGSEDDADLVIYCGFYPSLFSKEMALEDKRKPDTDGAFILQKMKWMNFEDPKRSLIVREQLFTDDDIQKNVQVHIAMISNSQFLIDELTIIAKDILLKHNK